MLRRPLFSSPQQLFGVPFDVSMFFCIYFPWTHFRVSSRCGISFRSFWDPHRGRWRGYKRRKIGRCAAPRLRLRRYAAAPLHAAPRLRSAAPRPLRGRLLSWGNFFSSLVHWNLAVLPEHLLQNTSNLRTKGCYRRPKIKPRSPARVLRRPLFSSPQQLFGVSFDVSMFFSHT